MQSDKHTISVILPVYNVQEYLPRCLDSIINNSFPDLEIICVDDGSTDNSLDILRSYEKQDSRIKVYVKENGGISSARNEGLRHCSGEWVAFIDSDDWIHKEYFSVLHSVQIKKDYDVVICDPLRTEDVHCMAYEIKKYDINDLDRISYMSSHKTKSYVWGRIFKREIIANILFQEDEKVEDAVYNLQVALKNPNLKAAFVDLPLYAYFVRAGSLVSKIKGSDVFNLAKRFYNSAAEEQDKKTKDVLYRECLKRSLSARYDFSLHKKKAERKQCDLLAKNSLKLMSGNKAKFAALVYIPVLYRTFRIIQDPTMRNYEKNVRALWKK